MPLSLFCFVWFTINYCDAFTRSLPPAPIFGWCSAASLLFHCMRINLNGRLLCSKAILNWHFLTFSQLACHCTLDTRTIKCLRVKYRIGPYQKTSGHNSFKYCLRVIKIILCFGLYTLSPLNDALPIEMRALGFKFQC